MNEVLCTGLSFCDLIFVGLESIPLLGRESACGDFLVKAGGAANTPMALARLGVRTLFASVVGRDAAGSLLLDSLKESGLDLGALIVDPEGRTSVSAVLSLGRDRAFASYFAEAHWSVMERQMSAFAPGCRRMHSYVADCMNMPVVETARRNALKLSVDASWNESIRLEDIRFILDACDVFLANEDEAVHLTGETSAEAALAALSDACVGRVVVKLGAKGAIVAPERGGPILRIPAIPAPKLVDTTGAGDLFAAGLIAGLCWDWPVEEAGRLAAASGAFSVGYPGGMDASYTKDAVLGFLDHAAAGTAEGTGQ